MLGGNYFVVGQRNAAAVAAVACLSVAVAVWLLLRPGGRVIGHILATGVAV